MRKKLTIVAAAGLLSTPAFAHHPLGGMPLQTFEHGLLSGVGHPILGFDHLFFVVAVGILAAVTGRALVAPLGYIGGMLGGVLLALGGVALPAVELVIALSLIGVGAILMRGKAFHPVVLVSLFALAGVFHGWAFGGTLAGQEAAAGSQVVTGYLIGLALTQYLIAFAAGALFGSLVTRDPLAPASRMSGALVAGAGALLVLEMAEAAAFTALGWS